MTVDQAEIIRLTKEYGGEWGLQHTHRLLQLIAEIGQGLDYNYEVVWLAAHLHDWGAYPAWVREGVDHSMRSKQVAETFLTERGVPENMKALVLECIELHHAPGMDRSIESILLRDADALDFLGVVGVLRNFSMNPRDLRKGFEETKRRRDKMIGVLSLSKSQDLAGKRVEQMNAVMAQFEKETEGYF
jgi:uncharacterized protein